MNDLDDYKTHESYGENMNIPVIAAALLFALAVGIQEPVYAQEPTEGSTVTNADGAMTLTEAQMDVVTAAGGVNFNTKVTGVFSGDLRDLPTSEASQPGEPVREIPRGDSRGNPGPLNGSKPQQMFPQPVQLWLTLANKR